MSCAARGTAPLLLTVALLASASGALARKGGFQQVITHRALGSLVASVVGPGPEAGSERLYLSYVYVDNTLDIVAVDPQTGKYQLFANPAPGETGARSMAVGPDGCIYLGTLPHAHFFKLDPRANKLIDLGQPAAGEQYMWEVAFASDGKLYGVTYPHAKLVRFDPKDSKLEDLGRLDPTEEYARFIATSDEGFVYAGIGTTKANIAAYEIATGETREILPAELQRIGQPVVHRGRDGHAYAKLSHHFFRLDGFIATPIEAKDSVPAASSTLLHDGRELTVKEGTLETSDAAHEHTSTQPLRYRGNALNLFRLGMADDRHLYASSALPIHLLRIDAPTRTWTPLGILGDGEIYSFLAHDQHLLAASYAGIAPLFDFKPGHVFRKTETTHNPVLTQLPASSDWRPQAMIKGPDGKVYIGAVAGYGKLGGPLVMWDPATAKVTPFHHVVADESVVTLSVWNNLIVGGTTVAGGGGSHPTHSEAHVFLWDPSTQSKVFDVVPVPGATAINDLVTAPNGLIYGFAGDVMFVLDAQARSIETRVPVSFSPTIYNAIGVGSDGMLWGLAPTGIFRVNPETREATLVARSPKPITGGFAMDKRHVYFISGPEVWQWSPD
jgi:streptogramin lyase